MPRIYQQKTTRKSVGSDPAVQQQAGKKTIVLQDNRPASIALRPQPDNLPADKAPVQMAKFAKEKRFRRTFMTPQGLMGHILGQGAGVPHHPAPAHAGGHAAPHDHDHGHDPDDDGGYPEDFDDLEEDDEEHAAPEEAVAHHPHAAAEEEIPEEIEGGDAEPEEVVAHHPHAAAEEEIPEEIEGGDAEPEEVVAHYPHAAAEEEIPEEIEGGDAEPEEVVAHHPHAVAEEEEIPEEIEGGDAVPEEAVAHHPHAAAMPDDEVEVELELDEPVAHHAHGAGHAGSAASHERKEPEEKKRAGGGPQMTELAGSFVWVNNMGDIDFEKVFHFWNIYRLQLLDFDGDAMIEEVHKIDAIKAAGGGLKEAHATLVKIAALHESQMGQNIVNIGSGFYRWVKLGTKPSAMNCWEAVIYAAVMYGGIDKAWLIAQTEAATGKKVALTNQATLATAMYNILSARTNLVATVTIADADRAAIPIAHNTLLEFWQGGTLSHVAIGTGAGQALSLWHDPSPVMSFIDTAKIRSWIKQHGFTLRILQLR